ncbi:chemotaxis protein CheW [Synechococcus elongatus]|uniref:CheW protein n=2 Tax=Synechococcus elongatus TaxID=32046 RepID=Q31PH3_SYNE7|nr:chemotaxis protein CheW [Synechococcus elongatus]ABB57046.1 CheW protein [Synechococcus elongatus PCC 7942 = FACHB-805]AJD58434.1 chemotaxis protein CheW [Synechococcus elongatus UTEX 2973]MBD2587448.1 chemotaxis protein CheW [Synechococcus elongatus FACHB-242]MBD2688773.1 chemotaxis protein CheW [Synechococcus elongatus FACHB-1061]MBD2707844.1 chemotaxis protein CheW [Synechococcus elongatus PCC 7942 = FACHB-805]
MADPISTEPQSQGDPYLAFQVSKGEIFAFAATSVREVILQPADSITPMPNVAKQVLGMFNLRGRVIWVGDLAQLLGLPSQFRSDRPEVPLLAIEHGNVLMAVMIDQLGGMVWLNRQELQPISGPAKLQTFCRGERPATETGRAIRVLDPTVILNPQHWSL